MKAEIITIGDEICRGEILDSNAARLAAELWDADITVLWMTSCRDDVQDIQDALTRAAQRTDLVLVSGGLGPTEDDLTVDVVSRMLQVEPVVDETSRTRVAAYYRQIGRELVGSSLRQLRAPQGARIHGNPLGAAPCFEVAIGNTPLIFFPGPPREIAAILEARVGKRIAELRQARGHFLVNARRVLRVFGLGESAVADKMEGIGLGDGESLHYRASFPQVLLKLVVRRALAQEAEQRVSELENWIRTQLGRSVFGSNGDTLPKVVAQLLAASGKSIATAESCTGGLLGATLTEVAGASSFFLGGAVTYSNAEKMRQLGVRAETLDEFGAVSEETAKEMAVGIRTRVGADLSVAITGVAGPEGGREDLPVGTVWLALSDGARDGQGPIAKQLRLGGDRERVRIASAHSGLNLIRLHLLGEKF